MNNLITKDLIAKLHARLFRYVADEVGKPCRPISGSRHTPTDYDTARELILTLTKPTKDPETGLWYHAGREFWEYRGKDAAHYETLIPSRTEGFFQVFWPSGRFMAKKMSSKAYAPLIDDKCVLSIGPGSGLAEILIVKKRKPKLVACVDNDVFARAAFELNAEANDVETGKVLVMLDHVNALKAVNDGINTYRLYDTVLAADCLYGKETSRQYEAFGLARALKTMNQHGADVIIAERDVVKVRRWMGKDDYFINASRQAQNECGLTSEYLIAEDSIPIDRDAVEVIGLVPSNDCMTREFVTMHHWPAHKAKRPLPRLDMEWWKKPIS